MTILRSHQRKALEIAASFASGERSFESNKIITAHVTPGGGKTGLSQLYAGALLASGLIERVVILTPRRSLASQTIESWRSGKFGAQKRLINVTGKVLSDGYHLEEFGCVTTYQAAGAGDVSGQLASYASGKRTLAILDEPHHMSSSGSGEASAWLNAVMPIINASSHCLSMSGTLYRHDGQRIPLISYGSAGDVQADIVYSRRQALEEHAVLPIEVTRIPADVIYGRGGREFSVSLSEASGAERGPALRTALELASYRDEKILDFLREYVSYTKSKFDSSAIVVVHSQKAARHVALLIERVLGLDVALAISDEDSSSGAITAFRKGLGPKVLVTVGMAYEGLDSPHSTHIALFTATRSEPWCQQAIARVTRYNPDFGPWSDQRAYVTAPDDSAMRDILDNLLAEEKPSRVHEIRLAPQKRALDSSNIERTVPVEATPLAPLFSDDHGAVPNPDDIRWMRFRFWQEADGEAYGARDISSIANIIKLLGFIPWVTGERVYETDKCGTTNLWKITDRPNVLGRFNTISRHAARFAVAVVDDVKWSSVVGRQFVFPHDEFEELAKSLRERMLALGIPAEDIGSPVRIDVAS